jgi:hypothetical protein
LMVSVAWMVLLWLLPATMLAQQTSGDKESCGLINHKSDLPGVSIAITSKKCAFSPSELRNGVRVDYDLIVERELPGLLPLPQDMTGCQKPGPSGLITFRVIRGEGHTFCPQCDLGSCPKPAITEPTTLRPGHYAESLLWYGQTFTGNGDGMSTVPQREFPPGSYVLSISARGRRQSDRKGESLVPFGVTLEYRVKIAVNNKDGNKNDEEQHTSDGGDLP